MGIPAFLMEHTYCVYSYSSSVVPNSIGEMPSATISGNYAEGFDTDNLNLKGKVDGRITHLETLEPDVRSPYKDSSVDMSDWALGFFDIPDGFLIEVGDWIKNDDDDSRLFYVQSKDKMPGGKSGHHYECRLQTTEVIRRP